MLVFVMYPHDHDTAIVSINRVTYWYLIDLQSSYFGFLIK